ncbi:Zinc finger, BED-type domain containing protein [Trema orientale]|uniref:Zinc finger, BED-type domain containing protein n=1 Tax=Trema orientale TaxID=63057 RepID=A0A2P5F564_TREOI|nr:Zinc finger, BED-type domain containing protein [Trema orientale]
MVRGRDACWEHCVLVDANRQKVRCNYCQREFSGGVYRMKFHLAQIKNKDIVPCTEVPIDVRDRILSILSTPKKQKANKKQKVDQAAAVANGREDSSSASGGFHPNHGSSGQNGSTCPSLLFPRRSPSAQPVVEDAERQKRDDADKKIAIFFFNNCIPFSAAKSTYYQEMVDAIAECGTGYRAPSYEKLRSSLLEKVKGDIHDCYKKYREEWKETGCTILCDTWSDGRTKSLLVFSVTCPKGTLFLKSVDVSANKDDPNYMFELLESVVLEIGVENVVQVVTDTAASSSYAGRLLMAKYNSLFWSPCASCCIDKILEDIGNLDWVNTVLEDAKTITRYIYSHSWTLNMMRKFTGGRELIRPRISRYVTNFLSLRSIVIQEDNLKHMFSHTEWLSSMYSRRPEAQAIKSLLYLDRFWKYAHEAVSVSEPFVKILRIVDGDMPAMGYMYEGIERAKISLKAYYKGVEQNYKPIWDMIERRWNLQVDLSLHAAAAFLNPSIFYNPIFKIDAGLRNGFQEAMSRMATTDNDKMEITKEHPAYIGAQGALGTQFAIMGRTLNAPGDWWAGYGYEIPNLQRVAIRILSQPCSSHWCRWNWTTFESLHSKKRNRLELEKLNDLVFVHCNLWLQGTCQSRGGKSKPIIFDEIDVSSEWPTELDPSAPLLDDSWLDNLPLDFRASP